MGAILRKGKAKPINDMTSRDNIRVVMPKESSGKIHITQKPLDFIEKLVGNSSETSNKVLDLFCGSGTTGVACSNLNRNFIGIDNGFCEKEKSEFYNWKWIDVAKHRIENEGK